MKDLIVANYMTSRIEVNIISMVGFKVQKLGFRSKFELCLVEILKMIQLKMWKKYNK